MSGGINMFFLDRVIGNAYNNLTNIMLVITSRDARTDKAVLVGAHYDSVIGSLGAPFSLITLLLHPPTLASTSICR